MQFTQSIGLGHVGLNVTDIDSAKQFFVDALGFEIAGEGQHHGSRFAFLGHNGKMTLTLWEQSTKGAEFSVHQPGLHHLAFAVDDIARLEEVREHLKSRNVTFFHEGDIVAHREGGDSSAIYFAGPDNTRLEVFAPNGGKSLSAPVSGAPTCGFF
ncbi:MAG: VOC family protein [Fibrella sp.]|nr:VOC family protein [Armatimonadota bacterium]